MKKVKFIILSLFIPLILNACTGGQLRRSLGVDKPIPDEFMVLKRDGLKAPDSLTLPKPGTEENKAEIASENAKNLVLGIEEQETNSTKKLSAIENSILVNTNKFKAKENIKEIVDEEREDEDSLLSTIIDPFGYNSGSDEILKPLEENKRIQKAIFEEQQIKGEDSKIFKKYKKRRD